jgi:hypothetical protein
VNRREAIVASVAGALGVRFVQPETLIAAEKPQLPCGQQGLDGINRALRHEFSYGDFVFFFTGWKMAQDTSMLFSQAIASRKAALRDRGHEFDFYYAASPGDDGAAGGFHPGDTFCMWGEHAEALYVDDFHSDLSKGGFDKAVRLRDDAFARLLKTMREHGEKV